MSSSSSVQTGQHSEEVWSHVAPYLFPAVAAPTAIVPVFYGFVAKSAQQTGKPIPRMKKVLMGGVKTTRTVGVIVGTQLIMQNAVEKKLMKHTENNDKPSFTSMLFSSVLVGAISAPFLAAFNGQTMVRNVIDSLRSLSGRQTAAIVFRETSFLFSLTVSGPISLGIKKIGCENKAIEYCSVFFSGFIGSIVGHPADTALTLWQKGKKVESFRQSMKGAPLKAIAVGGFSLIYKITKDLLKPLS